MLNHTCLISIINTVLDSDQSELTAFLSLPLIYSKTQETDLSKGAGLLSVQSVSNTEGKWSICPVEFSEKLGEAAVNITPTILGLQALWTKHFSGFKEGHRRKLAGSKTKKLTFDFLSFLLDDLLLFVSSECPASSTSPGNLSVIWIHLA